MPKCLPLWQNNSQKGHLMPDFLISSEKNVADFPYLFQKLRFRISHLLLERVLSINFANNQSAFVVCLLSIDCSCKNERMLDDKSTTASPSVHGKF